MKLEAKELVEAVQASLAVSLESRVPETNFVVGKMIGGLWKAFHRTLISSDGSGDILFSNIKVNPQLKNTHIRVGRSLIITLDFQFYEDAQFFKNTNKLRTIMGRARMATGKSYLPGFLFNRHFSLKLYMETFHFRWKWDCRSWVWL